MFTLSSPARGRRLTSGSLLGGFGTFFGGATRHDVHKMVAT